MVVVLHRALSLLILGCCLKKSQGASCYPLDLERNNKASSTYYSSIRKQHRLAKEIIYSGEIMRDSLSMQTYHATPDVTSRTISDHPFDPSSQSRLTSARKGEKEHRTSKRNQNKGTCRTAADTELKQLPAGSSGVLG